MFPFYDLNDEELFECILGVTYEMKELYNKCMFLEKNVTTIADNSLNNYTEMSKYISHDKLETLSQDVKKSFSLIHFNCRSLKSNFDEIECLLHRCKAEFKVIGLSETWMSDENGDCYDNFYLNGYIVYYANRKLKKGGGTALFVKDTLQHKCVKELTYSIENCFDVVTVEIKENRSTNIYVSCLYRPPNVCMNKFIDNYTAFLQKIENKKVLICGDFNVDLIKSESSNDTTKFLDLIYSVGQYPLITMPTRITDKSSTCIDNIFY